MIISKSDYMLFLKQPAWLWVKKNAPDKIPPIDENTQALFDAGHQFEPYVESLFPEGVSIGFNDYDEYKTLVKRTSQAIDSGAQVLFQAGFEWKSYIFVCDIVSFVSKNELDLFEIKASTKVKPEHEFDLAFQVAVLEGCGYKVRNISVIHVNNQYVRNGEIEADKLTVFSDITETVREKMSATLKYMPMALATAQNPKMPDPSPDFAKLGSKNDWLKIYENIVPQEPKEYPEDVKATIQHDKIKEFIDKLKYPLYFLDYETLMRLIPYFDGHRPYQQVPFQYSLHVLESPDAEVKHLGYLHNENSNPARPLTERLIKDIGDTGSILVWYEGFEKARNKELGDMLPEYKEAMESINNRIVDLMVPFKSKCYDDPRCEGSASIKKVLPVLCPELSYKTLGIQEGGSAQRLWMEAVLDEKRIDQKDQILTDLTEYCKLDTLAMVEIYNKLVKI